MNSQEYNLIQYSSLVWYSIKDAPRPVTTCLAWSMTSPRRRYVRRSLHLSPKSTKPNITKKTIRIQGDHCTCCKRDHMCMIPSTDRFWNKELALRQVDEVQVLAHWQCITEAHCYPLQNGLVDTLVLEQSDRYDSGNEYFVQIIHINWYTIIHIYYSNGLCIKQIFTEGYCWLHSILQ